MTSLRFYSLIQSLADGLLAALQAISRPVQAVRVWAWTNATKANLASCGERPAKRTILS